MHPNLKKVKLQNYPQLLNFTGFNSSMSLTLVLGSSPHPLRFVFFFVQIEDESTSITASKEKATYLMTKEISFPLPCFEEHRTEEEGGQVAHKTRSQKPPPLRRTTIYVIHYHNNCCNTKTYIIVQLLQRQQRRSSLTPITTKVQPSLHYSTLHFSLYVNKKNSSFSILLL